jgi:anaphase-promoting complex subunit 10
LAGTGHHDLIQFAEMTLATPSGWQDVPVAHCGGGDDGHSLCCYIVQIHIKDNHQNGKDTHLRGIKVYALDETSGAAGPISRVPEPADPVKYVSEDQLGGADEAAYRQLLEAMDSIGHGLDDFSGSPEYLREPEIR